MQKCYFDNSATTRLDPRVLKEMLPYFTDSYGNASSIHSIGNEAKTALEESRERLAALLKTPPGTVIFTSGGTEANNLALKGYAFANRNRGTHIITSSVEHDSVLNPCRWLEQHGFTVTYLPVNNEGFVDVEVIKKHVRKDTILLSLIHANNEIGTIEPIQDIGKLCQDYSIAFHTDACQSFTKVPLDMSKQPIDLLTLNAHKIYGPKGVGALVVRDGITVSPWQHGGGHEHGMRSSTENIPGIVGFAAAAQLSMTEYATEVKRLTNLRDQILTTILQSMDEAYLNGPRDNRLCNNVNFGFSGLEGEAVKLLMELDARGFIVSTGSACTSNQGENKPSHVLTAIGRNQVEARGALRITLGRFNTKDEVDRFLAALPEAMQSMTSIFSFSRR